MTKKILFTLVALFFVASCATSPETGEDGKQDNPENIDSDITFDGASNAEEDPFFSEPIEGGEQPAETADATEETEVELPEPTPEPSVTPEPTFADQPAPQEEYEEPAPMEEPEPEAPSPEPVADKKPASVTLDAMRAPGSDCSLRDAPGTDGKRLGVAKKGRKIWTENHDGGWFKVYRKKGHAFVSKSCF